MNAATEIPYYVLILKFQLLEVAISLFIPRSMFDASKMYVRDIKDDRDGLATAPSF